MSSLITKHIERLAMTLPCVMVLVFVDQYSKAYVVQHYLYGQSIAIWSPFIHCYVAYNKDAAFSFLAAEHDWQQLLFVMITVVMSVVIVRYLIEQTTSTYQTIAVSLFLGGSIGNAIDRIQYHYVIDFIKIGNFPVFNCADIFICTDVFLMIMHIIFQKVVDTS